MSTAWVRLHGRLSVYYGEKNADMNIGEDGISILLSQEKESVASVLSKLHIPVEMVGFIAINGVACAKEAMIADGDKAVIYPHVIGG